MPSSPLTYFLWFFAPVVLVGAAASMKRRNLIDQFPMFFSYCCFQAIGAMFLFAIHRFSTPEAYYYAYWVNTGLGAGLGFFVIRESFVNTLKPYVGLRDAGMLLFRWAAVILVVFAAISYIGGTGSGMARIAREITMMQRNILLIQAGLLLFVVMCSNYLNISWKSFPFGVTCGVGIFAANDLIVWNILSAHNVVFSAHTLSLVSQAMWALSSVTWFVYAFKAVPEKRLSPQQSYNAVVDRWNQAAMLIMNSEAAPSAEHSYLSDIERTVESVLATSSK
jgi:hypothetical protein